MNKYTITLSIYGVTNTKKPGESLTLNWYRNAHYRTNNNAKKRFKKLVAPQLLELDALTGKLRIDYIYYAKRKGTDLDNFTSTAKKYFQDALVELGIIPDDNCGVIVDTREKYAGIDKENPRIEVVIYEIAT